MVVPIFEGTYEASVESPSGKIKQKLAFSRIGDGLPKTGLNISSSIQLNTNLS